MGHKRALGSVSTWVMLALAVGGCAESKRRAAFVSPPDEAKPQTWWHWMNGNVTREGITADLEAMKEIGLGGATIVNVDCGIPPGTEGFMTPQWREDFRFAVSEADRLGLKLCVENCAGWSSSGGPWNKPANAMQRLTSSEVVVHGPARYEEALPEPESNLGYYRDVAVLAFRAPAGSHAGVPAPAVAAKPVKLEVQHAWFEPADGSGTGADVADVIRRKIAEKKKTVMVDPDELGTDPAMGVVKRLRLIYTADGKAGVLTVDEGDVMTFPTAGGGAIRKGRGAKTAADRTYVRPPAAAEGEAGQVVRLDEIADLTAKMGSDGKLTWDVPEGDWVVLRLGHTPIGVNNHPAPPEGTGLECDKFSRAALDAHWDGFMTKVLKDVGPLGGKALDTSLIDSYEVGDQDWTPAFRMEFFRRRGYDPLKFLVTYSRRTVESPETTERFLWDMRRTFADLFADNYFAHFTELCHKNGLASAIEPYTGPFESLQCGSTADVVMGEFWTGSNGHPSVKMAASIAHIYGKTVVAAESFTANDTESRWQNDPYSLKRLGDLMYCQGLNRYVFHRYAMQPWMNRYPGMTMGPWGINFERTETWWNQGKGWIEYIGRCEHVLRQGRAVADVAYFTGESAPVEMRNGPPATPEGYDWDAVNADVLMHASVEGGRIKLASGASYAVLVLPPSDANMTPKMMECLGRLVRAGATVVGQRPAHSPSLADYPHCDERVRAMAAELWGDVDGKTVMEHSVGKGKVCQGKALGELLMAGGLAPDFEFEKRGVGSRLASCHRAEGETDYYFVSNQQERFDDVECTFRVSGKVPELWHPETGQVEPAAEWNEEGGRTKVRLRLDPAGSVFVVFRPGTAGGDHVVSAESSIRWASAAARVKLEIKRAVYAARDGTGESDVTSRLAGMMSDGRLDVAVTNNEMGGDPANLRKKELRVDYVLDGKPQHKVVSENRRLMLPQSTEVGMPAPWEAFAEGGRSTVRFWENGSAELRTAGGKALAASTGDLPAPVMVTGAWDVSFPPNLGAPATARLETLASWTDNADSGVRYFSGTATYTKTFDVSAEQLAAGRELWLDLGVVKNFAEVEVNGKPLGVLWKPPFRVNVTGVARPGANALTVKVTNLWANRIIGDEQLPPDVEYKGAQLKEFPKWLLEGKPSPTGRITFETWHHWDKDAPLLESGLLGPVMLRSADVVPAK